MSLREFAHAKDMAGNEKLHRLDVAATLSGDVTALSEGWTGRSRIKKFAHRRG
jgi:hypothetical protein